MNTRLTACLMVGAVLLVAPGLACAAEDQLPEDLRALRAGLGCGPVAGFFDRPGMVEPPYIYGVFPGDREGSAAFWCQKAADEQQPYRLVVVEKGRVVAAIPWEVFPGGLSRQEAGDALSDFRAVDDPKRPGPSGTRTSYPALRSEYDGIITLFYRYDGQWLYQLSH